MPDADAATAGLEIDSLLQCSQPLEI